MCMMSKAKRWYGEIWLFVWCACSCYFFLLQSCLSALWLWDRQRRRNGQRKQAWVRICFLLGYGASRYMYSQENMYLWYNFLNQMLVSGRNDSCAGRCGGNEAERVPCFCALVVFERQSRGVYVVLWKLWRLRLQTLTRAYRCWSMLPVGTHINHSSLRERENTRKKERERASERERMSERERARKKITCSRRIFCVEELIILRPRSLAVHTTDLAARKSFRFTWQVSASTASADSGCMGEI